MIDEHAVREEPGGVLGGLHEIRSEHLDAAVRDGLCSSVESSLTEAVDSLRASDFAIFIVRVLRQRPELKDALLNALAQRLVREPSRGWSWIFHGLGLVTLDHIAIRWTKIARELGIDPQHTATIFALALTLSEFGDGPQFEKINRAISRFSEISVSDLRRELCA